MRRLEPRFLEALDRAQEERRRTVLLIAGPRKAGMRTFLKQVLPDALSVDFSNPSVTADAEDAPHTFLARYSASPVLLLLNAHLAPRLAAVAASHAGEACEPAGAMAPKIIVMASALGLETLLGETPASDAMRAFRLRTLAESEITGAGGDFLERLAKLDFPSVLSHDENNRDLILGEAMRGGYPGCRDGSADVRHDFFHALIREICRLDLPKAAVIRSTMTLRKVYRMTGAASGEILNVAEIAKVLGIGRPLAARCLFALEALHLVDSIPVWTHSADFERSIKRPRHVVTDSGWLCGLLGFCSTDPATLSAQHLSVVERLLYGWTYAQLASLVDNQPHLRLSHFGLRTGLSIDFLIEDLNAGSLTAILVRPKERIDESDFAPLKRFRALLEEKRFPDVQSLQTVILYCGQSARRFEGLGAAVPLAFFWR